MNLHNNTLEGMEELYFKDITESHLNEVVLSIKLKLTEYLLYDVCVSYRIISSL